MSKFFSRKFIVSVLAILMSGVALIVGQITAEQFLPLMIIAAGIYQTANVMQKWGEAHEVEEEEEEVGKPKLNIDFGEAESEGEELPNK